MNVLKTNHINVEKNKSIVKITLKGNSPPTFILIVFSLSIIISFSIPIIVSFLIISEGGFHIGLLFSFGLCWAITAYLSKIMLWNFYGKEHIWFDDEVIYYQADYKYFKGNIQSIPFSDSDIGYIEQDDNIGQLHLINGESELLSVIKIPLPELESLKNIISQ